MSSVTFADLKLIAPLLEALASENYTTPTPIQAAAIPPLLKGHDLLGCAQTGTGKTAAFALPILQHLDATRKPAVPNAPRVLVLAPTRELATQIFTSFATYGRSIHFRQATVFGGVSASAQVRALARGVHIVVATPGRLLDLMQQGHVTLDKVEIFVLDEADRMLDMGFLPALRQIIARLPQRRQSLFFSATMPQNILDLTERLLTDPVQVRVAPPASPAELIEQQVFYVANRQKTALLCRILHEQLPQRALVFTRTKHGADRLARQLAREGYRTAALHGNKSQAARERTLSQFREGSVPILIATDLAARGIDVDGISHVINYDVPREPESYVHRIGRTGRAGATGIALSFCDAEERLLLRSIERVIGRRIAVSQDHPDLVGSESAPRGESAGERRPASRGNGSRRSSARGSRARGSASQGSRSGRKQMAAAAPAPTARPARVGRRFRRAL